MKFDTIFLSALPAAFVNYHSIERRECATGRSDGQSRLRATDATHGEASLGLSHIRACQGAAAAQINEKNTAECTRKWNREF